MLHSLATPLRTQAEPNFEPNFEPRIGPGPRPIVALAAARNDDQQPAAAPGEDRLGERLQRQRRRLEAIRQSHHYFFHQELEPVPGGARVRLHGRDMLMLASYSYLGLIDHPRIREAAAAAALEYGTGVNGVRLLAGTLRVHRELEETLAAFKDCEDAVTFSSGYAANVATVSALVGPGDVVIGDSLNHASIVDGCRLSGAHFKRFAHNDTLALERCLQQARGYHTKLVVVDAVFSMDGDLVDLPRVASLCRRYGAWLMVDEAHALGVVGKTGRGIEEHFGLGNVIDIKMGTLSKAIPAAGGYIAGSRDLIEFLRHTARAHIFSGSIPPPAAAAAMTALKVIIDEPERVAKLHANAAYFLRGLKALGFNTLSSETAIAPIVCGSDERAYELTRACHARDVFVLPVVSPAVPQGSARLRTTVTAAHERQDLDDALSALVDAAAGERNFIGLQRLGTLP